MQANELKQIVEAEQKRLERLEADGDSDSRVTLMLAEIAYQLAVGNERESDVPSQREFCVCAALKMPRGEIIYGHRHNHCYDVVRARMNALHPSAQDGYRQEIIEAGQSFVTSSGRFVDRTEAMSIQRESGKPSKYHPDGKYTGEDLFSEDLY